MARKIDWNKRIKQIETQRKKKVKIPFLIQNISIEEVFDESGEVLEDTIIKFSFDGLLVYLSVSNAMKMNKLLNDVLDFNKDK